MRPAIFLDRDGTINREVNYLSDPARFELLPSVGEAVRRLNQLGWPVVVVTNQSGLARGYFSRQTLNAIHARMHADLHAAGATIDGVYICPHHPNDGCDCRKPKPGLFLQAARDLNLNLSQSFIIGDKLTDLLPGRELGCQTVLVLTGHGQTEYQHRQNWFLQPNTIAAGLSDAVDWIYNLH